MKPSTKLLLQRVLLAGVVLFAFVLGTLFVLARTRAAPQSTGSLAGSVALNPGPVNFTTEGSQDWAHWDTTQNTGSTQWNHKATGNSQIQNFVYLGTPGNGPLITTNGPAVSWTDGVTPNTSATNDINGSLVHGANNGLTFKVYADTNSRILRIYTGAFDGTLQFQASLDDASAQAYADVSTISGGPAAVDSVYSITYAAGSITTLTITVTLLAATPTPAPTNTATSTPTTAPTATPTVTPTNKPTPTPTATPTPTNTPVAVSASVPTMGMLIPGPEDARLAADSGVFLFGATLQMTFPPTATPTNNPLTPTATPTNTPLPVYQKFTSTETSPVAVSMASVGGILYIAWVGSGNHYINMMHSSDGGLTFDSATKYTSTETSLNPVSLTSLNGALYVAWTGTGNNYINVMHSVDGGMTLSSATKYTSPETSANPVSLSTANGTLYVEWTGVGNNQINLMRSTDGGQTFDDTTKYTSVETSPVPVSMVGLNGVLFVAWVGTGNHFLNLMHSTDAGLTFNSATKYTSPETSPNPITMTVYSNTLYVAWSGSGNNYLNYMNSPDNGATFSSATKFTSTQTSQLAPSVVGTNGLYIAWVGVGNGQINLLRFK